MTTAATPSSTVPRRREGPLAVGLMAASGFAGLGYQIVWTQQAALWLGHESAAVLAVVAAFFGGLALGAFILGARIARSPRPARWYAGCEAAIGLWSAVLAWLMPVASTFLLQVVGVFHPPVWQWTVAFAGTFLMLLPATAAMGATLPAMERVLATVGRRGTSLAALYAANTFGAVVGVLAAAFWLVPELGLVRTAAICGGLNLACALAALALPTAGAAAPPMRPWRKIGSRLPLRLAATGFLGIGYEVIVVRVLSQVAEDTVYTFALLLAVYLLGSALGAAAYQRSASTPERPDGAVRDRLIGALAAACLLGAAGLWGAEALHDAALEAFGAGMCAALSAELVLALAAFFLPTVAMGAVFCQLATEARAAGFGLHRALGLNTLGAAAAPCIVGVLWLPAVGPKYAVLAVVAGYLGLLSRPAWRTPAVRAAVMVLLAVAVLAPPLAFIDVPEGGHVVSYREGATASVSVVEDATGVRRLRIDNRQQEGSSASRLADARQALLPLLLHPAPKQALFLGLGTGVTASAAAEDKTLSVDAVELLPEVIAASTEFVAADAPAHRLHTVAADARRFVRVGGARYDVIVADNFHPARSGSGALYTVEHFRAVGDRLADGGIFCQWLPLHQLDLTTLRSIVRSFVAVFPDGAAMLATNSLETPVLGLVARAGGTRFDAASVRDRLVGAASHWPLAEFGLNDDFAVLGSFVAGPGALARFAGDAPRNTDDRPVVAYRAPRLVYAQDSLPRDRLIELLGQLDVGPGELDVPAGATRLAAYREARNRFLEAGRQVRPSADVGRMLSQVQVPLLAVLRVSPDFRPAYDPLLRMATALERTDADAARDLWVQLAQAQPGRPEAGQALRRLAVAPP